jgi:tetratricopeptide (TPR) repeat protein
MTAAVAARRRLYAVCPLHGVRFAIRGQEGPIECNVAPHMLTDHYPASDNQFVELCTACDTVWPFSPASPATQCMNCGVSFGQRSLCKHCSVFTLTPNGVASIGCAGCGSVRQSEQVHRCPEVGSFTTARAECPFCLDALVPLGPTEVSLPEIVRQTSAAKPVISDTKQPADIGGPANSPSAPDDLQLPDTLIRRRSRIPLYVVIALLLIGGLLYFSLNDFGSRIDRALAAHRYFPPDQDSVYDIYTTEAAKHPDSVQVKAAATKIIAKLAPEADAQLASFYRDSDPKNWTTLARSYGFLEVLSPADIALKTKHAYAEGQRLLVDDHDYIKAFDSFRRALSFDGRFVLAINGIAKVYIQDSSPLRDETAAVRSYEEAMAADPNFTWAPKNLGEFYMQKEQWERAEYYMSRALQASPTRPSILAALGRIAFNRHNYISAQDYYLRAIRVATKPEDLKKYNHALQQIRERL